MAGTSSLSSRSGDSKHMEDASSASTPSSGAQENGTFKVDCIGEDHVWTTIQPKGNLPGTRYNHLSLFSSNGAHIAFIRKKYILQRIEGTDKDQHRHTMGPHMSRASETWTCRDIRGKVHEHSAAVIGRKMLVVGGDSDRGMLNDVQQLHLGKLTWTGLAAISKSKASQQLPLCRGHSLVSWGQRLLLVTGETDPPMDFVSVWSFDLEKDNWSNVEAKGELPVARIGHSVTRAGSVLILFGGEDSKGRKLNDLHMFDLKSSMWLPLLAMGSVPSPRSKHVAAIYDERLLLVFGGQTKNKSLNDLYALDFEAMEWSRLKARGVVPGPRAGAAGVLFNDNWYIAGGDSNGKRYLETIALDITRMTWSVVARSNINSPSASQGFSLVLAQRKGKTFLVAFGGRRPGIASEVEVLFISEEHIDSRKPDEITVKKPVLGTRLADQVAIHPDVIMPNERLKESGRSPSSEDQVNQSRIESPRDKPSEEAEGDSLINAVPAVISEKDAEEVTVDTGQSDESESKQYSLEVKASYEKKLAAALKRNEALEAQLKAANTSRDDAERSLVTVIKSRQKTEKRLAIALKEIEVLKEKLRVADLGQEESMNLTNIVHTENMRLDHDLAFLKAVLEDTQKELQTTRGVLSSERSRAFQLQVELFELKQTMQSLQSDTSNS